jgi:hypothetical protein
MLPATVSLAPRLRDFPGFLRPRFAFRASQPGVRGRPGESGARARPRRPVSAARAPLGAALKPVQEVLTRRPPTPGPDLTTPISDPRSRGPTRDAAEDRHASSPEGNDLSPSGSGSVVTTRPRASRRPIVQRGPWIRGGCSSCPKHGSSFGGCESGRRRTRCRQYLVK